MRNQNAQNQILGRRGQANSETASNTDHKPRGMNGRNEILHQEGVEHAPTEYEAHSLGNLGQNGRNLKVHQASGGGPSERSYGTQSHGVQSRAVQSVKDG